MLFQEKVPGGKLLCVDVEVSGGRVARIRITGDFFLHPEDAIERLEAALVGAGPDDAEERAFRALEDARATLIGATPADIGRLVRRAFP